MDNFISKFRPNGNIYPPGLRMQLRQSRRLWRGHPARIASFCILKRLIGFLTLQEGQKS